MGLNGHQEHGCLFVRMSCLLCDSSHTRRASRWRLGRKWAPACMDGRAVEYRAEDSGLLCTVMRIFTGSGFIYRPARADVHLTWHASPAAGLQAFVNLGDCRDVYGGDCARGGQRGLVMLWTGADPTPPPLSGSRVTRLRWNCVVDVIMGFANHPRRPEASS